MKGIKSLLLGMTLAVLFPVVAQAGSASVYMEDLTWTEVQARMQGGATTVLIPTGGTEQEGPHMVNGMHTAVMHSAAGDIARKVGNTLVAPVIPYAPSGRIVPAEGHMRFAGTISLTDQTYESVLEDTARSLKQHGFRMICFLGDSAGSQLVMSRVAARLADEWGPDGVRVLHLSQYFAEQAQDEWSDSMTGKVANPTAHAGHIETSEMMAVDAGGVRDNMRGVRSERDYPSTGAMGDSSVASATYGKKYLSLKIEAAVKQIQNASGNAQ